MSKCRYKNVCPYFTERDRHLCTGKPVNRRDECYLASAIEYNRELTRRDFLTWMRLYETGFHVETVPSGSPNIRFK